MHTAPRSLLLNAVFKLLYPQPWYKKCVVYPFVIMCTQDSNETQKLIYSSPKLMKLIILTNWWCFSLTSTFPVQVLSSHGYGNHNCQIWWLQQPQILKVWAHHHPKSNCMTILLNVFPGETISENMWLKISCCSNNGE